MTKLLLAIIVLCFSVPGFSEEYKARAALLNKAGAIAAGFAEVSIKGKVDEAMIRNKFSGTTDSNSR